MKLYTEEQVRKAMSKKLEFPNDDIEEFYSDDEILKSLTPIELPSDEEISEKAISLQNEKDGALYNEGINEGFYLGVEYIKKQILNPNKQNTNTNFTPHNANAVAEYNEGLKNFTPHNANAVAEYNEGLKNFTPNKNK